MNGLAQSGNDVNVLSYFPVTDSHANYKQFIFDGIPVINSSINLNELVGFGMLEMDEHFFYDFFTLYNNAIYSHHHLDQCTQ